MLCRAPGHYRWRINVAICCVQWDYEKCWTQLDQVAGGGKPYKPDGPKWTVRSLSGWSSTPLSNSELATSQQWQGQGILMKVTLSWESPTKQDELVRFLMHDSKAKEGTRWCDDSRSQENFIHIGKVNILQINSGPMGAQTGILWDVGLHRHAALSIRCCDLSSFFFYCLLFFNLTPPITLRTVSCWALWCIKWRNLWLHFWKRKPLFRK